LRRARRERAAPSAPFSSDFSCVDTLARITPPG
jgi:hypothetical protein